MKIKSPSPQLKEYVKYYWSLDYKHSSKEEQGIIPTGLAEIYFHFENLPTIGNNEVNSQLFLSKPSLKPHKILLEGHISFVAVALYPHTPMLLFDFPQNYFSQGTIPLNLTADNSWGVLHNKLYDLGDFDNQVNLIEEYLTGRIYQAKKNINFDRVISSVKNLSLQGGNMSTEQLSNHACLSIRQFSDIFKQYTGLTAGNMSKILRMQKAIYLMQSGLKDLAEIYYLCNYYDRSHFIKDSKALTGLTPKELLKDSNLCSDYYASL